MKFLLIRSFLTLFVVWSVSFSAFAQQQKVTINVSRVNVQVVFKLIKEQTKLNFVYNADQLNAMSSVTLNVQKVSVDSVLSKLFHGTSFEYKFEMSSIVIRRKSDTPKVGKMILSGMVVDGGGLSLPGVTVMLKGTSVGTTTDVDGKFKFPVTKREKNVLLFTFIGMKSQEVTVKDEKAIRVMLESDDHELDEVNIISNGFYDVDRRHSTSAVTSLKAEEILVPGINTIDQLLEGHVPGMIFMQNSGQVGATPKLKIRGTTTLLGSQSPLWVLDGVILSDPVNVDAKDMNDLDFVNLLGNAISGLNPEDVESIDVLKDASATAIYGPQASNGVIVIKTKKGKVGPPVVSYSVNGTFRQRPRYSDKAVNVMNSMERIDFSREVVEKKLTVPMSSWVGYEAAVSDLYAREITYEEFERRVDRMETANTDWFGLLLKNTFSHTHTLSLSGGSDNIRYYTSLGYNDESGNIQGESNKRYSSRISVNVNYNKFAMQAHIDGNLQKREYTPKEVNVMNYAYNTSRAVEAYDDMGELWFYEITNSGNFLQPFSIINERDHSYNKIKTSQVTLGVNLSYQLIPNLKASLSFAYNTSDTEDDTYFGEETSYAAELRKVNKYSGKLNEATTLLPKGGELRMDGTKNEGYNLRAQLQYNHFLDESQNHQIMASLTGDVNSKEYSGFKITRRGYMPNRGMIFDSAIPSDVKKPYTAYNTWLTTNVLALGRLKQQTTNLAALIGVVSYVYKNVYIVNVNARIDASNKFGDKSNEKLLPIWSISSRWNMHENIFKNYNKINTLALKASFGYQGNMSAQDSPDLQIRKKGMDNFFGEYYSEVNNFPNPSLKWEKTSNVNVGLDFAFFKNKLTGSVNYYYRRTVDAFMKKKVSTINGMQEYTVNRGTLTNQGYEFSFNFEPINTMLSKVALDGEAKGFVWRLNPNFGSVFNQMINKIKRKDKVLLDEIKYTHYLDGAIPIDGQPINTFYSYKYKGLDPKNGSPMFHDVDKYTMIDGKEVETRTIYEAMTQEEVYMTVMSESGCREPFLQGGISNYLGWGNWGLSFNIAYSVGSKIRMFKMYPGVADGSQTIVPGPENNMRREFVNRLRRPGDENITNVPGLLESGAFTGTLNPWWETSLARNKFAGNIWHMYDHSDLRVVSGDYMKLQNLSLRYVIPASICKKIQMKSAYVSLSGANLFTLASKKLKGQDPSQSGTSSIVNISVRPTYTFQVNVSF